VNNNLTCFICSAPLSVRMTESKNSHKQFIMLKCPRDGRHFRAFVADRNYINQVIKEQSQSSTQGGG
jgi:hypothetical protein